MTIGIAYRATAQESTDRTRHREVYAVGLRWGRSETRTIFRNKMISLLVDSLEVCGLLLLLGNALGKESAA